MNFRVAQLHDDELDRLLGLVREHTGINMDEGKRQLVMGRLGKRLRQLDIASFGEYCDEVSRPGSPELQLFINAVTTNLTSFFREAHHFRHLREELAPKLERPNGSGRIRIWSAGCSTGPEPYSVAMTLHDVLGSVPGRDWKILATDLDSAVLEQACAGIYDDAQIEVVPQGFRERYFSNGTGVNAGRVRVRACIRERVVFKQLNLMNPWPVSGPFDAIFCRNVSIYFDKPTQRRLFDRFADVMADNAVLYIGHSESLYRVSDRFKLLGHTIYEKAR